MKKKLFSPAGLSASAWLKGAVYFLAGYFIYRSSFSYLFSLWSGADFTYCYIVPFISLYILWEKRDRLASIQSVPSWQGLIPLLLGVFIFFVGDLGSEFTLQFFSFWFVLVGLCWLHLGWQKLKIISFPLAFSLAMFVPPNTIYAPLTLKLKLVSSQLGVKLMQCYGLSAYREGNVIDLGFTQLQVVDACSGLRYVIPLFVMGILMAYYYRAALWKRTFLVLSTIPLSILTNSLRIASVGILFQFWGPSVAEGFFHDFSGWFIFMASLGFLLLEMWVLKKIFKEDIRRVQESEIRIQNYAQSSASPHVEAAQGLAGFLRPPQFVVSVILLLATASVAQTVNFREKTPLVKPLNEIPLQVGEWSGVRQQMEQQYLDTLKLTDYAMVDYRNRQGKQVSFYVAYNASQSKGEATHSPATCLPSSGWVFNESGTAGIAGAGKTIEVTRAFMEKNGEKQLAYFWFPQRGRVLTSIYQIKLYNFWDALTRQRTDGALVRVITPVYESEGQGEAEVRLQRFARQMIPLLDSFLPQ